MAYHATTVFDGGSGHPSRAIKLQSNLLFEKEQVCCKTSYYNQGLVFHHDVGRSSNCSMTGPFCVKITPM